MSKERKTLEAQGFEGFRPIGELMNGVKSVIPAQMGVYVVLREDNTKPVFVTKVLVDSLKVKTQTYLFLNCKPIGWKTRT